jgi:hypothetical protein
MAGEPFYVSSTLRPGAVTAAGNLSNHALGCAVDFTAAHPDGRARPTVDSPELLGIFGLFRPYAAHLRELIYCGPGACAVAGGPNRCVKAGRWVNPYACPVWAAIGRGEL